MPVLGVPSFNRTDQNWKLPLKRSPLSQLGIAPDWRLAAGRGFASDSAPRMPPLPDPRNPGCQVSGPWGGARWAARTGSLLLSGAALSRSPPERFSCPACTSSSRALLPLPFRKPAIQGRRDPVASLPPAWKRCSLILAGTPGSPAPLVLLPAPLTSYLHVAHCWGHQSLSFQRVGLARTTATAAFREISALSPHAVSL